MLAAFKSLRKPYIDASFRMRGRILVRIVERPGMWMSDDEQRALIADLRYVVSQLGKGDLEYGVVSGDPERLKSAVITLLYEEGQSRPFAFNALPVLDCVLRGRETPVYHFGLGVIDPNHRGSGYSFMLYIFTILLLFARNQLRPIWVSNVTQVPAVYGLCCEFLDNLYPNPATGQRRTFTHLCLASEIMDKHRAAFGVGPEAWFDADRFVICNSYTGGSDNLKKSYAESTHHRKPVYNAACQRELDYVRGDDFLQLGQLNLSLFLKSVLRMVPDGSLIAFLTRGIFLGAQSVVLPFLHWLDVHRPLGELRPHLPRSK